MTAEDEPNILLDEVREVVSTALSEYEKINDFVYLGYVIEADGGSSAEIRRQIALS